MSTMTSIAVAVAVPVCILCICRNMLVASRAPQLAHADSSCPRNHPSDFEEIYGDLDDFWLDDLKVTLKALRSAGKSVSLDSLLPLVRSGRRG